jgi:hypothetical protein
MEKSHVFLFLSQTGRSPLEPLLHRNIVHFCRPHSPLALSTCSLQGLQEKCQVHQDTPTWADRVSPAKVTSQQSPIFAQGSVDSRTQISVTVPQCLSSMLAVQRVREPRFLECAVG